MPEVFHATNESTAALRVVVIGGGLSGMAAAVALESAGVEVTLLEARRSLGGRAGSFQDPQTGETIDNCQHVLLGCCTNLIDFYRRIGALQKIRFDRTIHFRDEQGRRHDLWGIAGVPAPLNLSFSLARFGALTLGERVALSRAMFAMLSMGRIGRAALADTRFGDWLDAQRQPESLVRRFYDPVIISGLNENTRDASAAYAIEIFQDAMLANERGYVMGVPSCPLGELYRALPLRDARLGARVSNVIVESDKIGGVALQGGETIPADAVVLATNCPTLDKLVPEPWFQNDARFAALSKIEFVPIVGAHMKFDRPVLREPHAAFMEGPLQWVFRKDSQGQQLHGVISAAREWVGRDRSEMLGLFEAQLRRVLPLARDAALVGGTVVVEKRATFSPTPGIDKLRPTQAPAADGNGLPNLFLAGDYTLTGWPATMEGAVRGGYLAADAVLARHAPQRNRGSFLVPDLPTQWPAKLLGL